MVRRLIASLALLAVAFSSAEAVVGELRDGEVHHEALAEAVLHDHGPDGEHGHEHDAPHGSDHRHGTSSDHCTHQHGQQLSGEPFLLAVHASAAPESFLEPSSLSGRFIEPVLRPPRA